MVQMAKSSSHIHFLKIISQRGECINNRYFISVYYLLLRRVVLTVFYSMYTMQQLFIYSFFVMGKNISLNRLRSL